jgi:hypothetical protein
MNILHTEGEVPLQQHINIRKKERHNGSKDTKSSNNNHFYWSSLIIIPNTSRSYLHRISNNNNTESLQKLLRAPPSVSFLLAVYDRVKTKE